MLAPRVRKNGDGKEFQFLPDLAVCTCPLADLTRFSPSNSLEEVFLLSLPFVSSPDDTLLLILQFLISKLKSIENVVFEVVFTVVSTLVFAVPSTVSSELSLSFSTWSLSPSSSLAE